MASTVTAPQYQGMVDAVAASLTTFIPVGISAGLFQTTETFKQVTYRIPGTISGLYMRIPTNTNGASTVTLRKNAANGNSTLSIGSSATGEFEDTTHTDTIAAGDKLALQLVTGAGGTTSPTTARTLFTPTAGGDWSPRYCTNDDQAVAAASTTNFMPISGRMTFVGTEAAVQLKAMSAGTLKNFFVNVTTNARTIATTFAMRKNAADTALTVSVGNVATGIFEDTAHTAAVAINDLIDSRWTTGTGTQTLALDEVAVDLVTTDYTMYEQCAFPGTVVNANVTTNFYVAGNMTANTTEAQTQVKSGVTAAAKTGRIYVDINGVTANSTLTFRINGVSGNITVSIPNAQTGTFEDITHTDNIVPTSEINWRLVTGASGTSMTMYRIGMSLTLPSGAIKHLFASMGVGR